MKSLFIILFLFGIFAISLGVISADAHTGHPNLIVSAENPDWDNTFSGFQVIEVVIDDPDISDTTIVQTEPTVLIYDYPLRMVQATDGKWYGYFTNYDYAKRADSTVITPGSGFDFGEFCSSTTNQSVLGIDVSNTMGVAIARPYSGTTSSTNGQNNFNACSGGDILSGNSINNVLRNPHPLVESESIPTGQIGLNPNAYPLIQLYELYGGYFPIQYVKNNVVQEITIEYDDSESLEAIVNSLGDTVTDDHIAIKFNSDIPFFNIDPTSRDSWTFLLNNSQPGLYYEVFDENGLDRGIDTLNVLLDSEYYLNNAESLEMTLLEFGNNVYDDLSPFQFKSNGLQTLGGSGGTPFLTGTSNILTIKESENNNGSFTNIDDFGLSNIRFDDVNPFDSTSCETYVDYHRTSHVIDFFDQYYWFDSNVVQWNQIPNWAHSDTHDYVCIQPILPNNSFIEDDVEKQIAITSNFDPYVTYFVESSTSHGILEGTAPNFEYTPDSNYFGADEFILNLTWNGFSHSFNVPIGVSPVQDFPTSDAGSDQTVSANSVVQLDGSQSLDVDGDEIFYSWIQTAGDPVTLTDSTITNPQFTAPSNDGLITFMLTVNDASATSNPDVVNIYVGTPVPEPTAPPAPTSLSSNPSDSTVVLNWQAPDDGGSAITDYVIEYKSANSSWSTYDDGVSSNTISIVSGLENNVAYQFRITAVNTVGISDPSTLISATPISSVPVAETPVNPQPEPTVPQPEPTVPQPEPTVPQPEPTVPQPAPAPEPELGIASFVDQTKDPQHYIDRYNNESTYKEWFDDNYSQYDSIYQAVGLDKQSEESVLETLVEPEPEMISEPGYVPEPVVEQEVNCGPGTESVNGICQAIPNFNSEQEVNCGPGTESVNGICQVIQTEEKSSRGGGCLIATATYGSELAPQVQQLRQLRDNQLLQTESGTAFMTTFNDIYYSFSPIIADMERENPYFKEAVKLAITPMISTLSLMESAESESEVLGIGISVIMLNIGMYFGVPAIVIVGIRKRF